MTLSIPTTWQAKAWESYSESDFEKQLIEAMTKPISDPASASAAMPYLLWIPPPGPYEWFVEEAST